MTFGRALRALLPPLLLATLPAAALAQNAVTISGHVTAGSYPVRGATVEIPALHLSARTAADGLYSFIVPSSRVRGQRVTITARYTRYAPQSFEIQLTGGTLVQDFDLAGTSEGQSARTPERQNAGAQQRSAALPFHRSTVPPFHRSIDSSAFAEQAGPTDLPGALAGRISGLQVTSAATINGSSVLEFRGKHSLAAPSAPLFVVDGFPVDNSSFNSRSEEFGAGGFDYGTAIRDLNLGDIASVTVLDQAQATMLYGGRAANGVVLVTTKSGRGLHGFEVAASQEASAESPLRLSSYQNAWGQGLDGQFEFFDGMGGGVNDGVAESWGPALSGQPVLQASLTQPRTPDVRLWLAQPNNVSDFFASGHTFTTNVSVQSGGDRGNYRVAASERSIDGLTPGSSGTRQTVAVNGSRSLTSRLSATLTGKFINDRASSLPGVGFNPGNSAASFAVMGRQVDVAALKSHVVDSVGEQINWIYTGWNNPYFESAESSNDNRRSRVLGGLSATYAFAPSISATARVGTDSYHETRDFTIAPTWIGGFPFYAGTGDFSAGGFQNQGISVHETNAELFVDGGPTGPGALPIHFTAGVSHRSNGLRLTTAGDDQPFVAGDTVTADQPPAPEHVISDLNTDAAFGGIQLGLGTAVSVNGAVRAERLTGGGVTESNVYPSVSGSLDLGRALTSSSMSGTQLHASWSRTGNQLTAAALHGAWFGLDSAGFPSALPASMLSVALAPELTNTWDAGLSIAKPWHSVGFDVTWYHERSSNLLLPGALPDSGSDLSADAVRNGVISNSGIEAQFGLTPVSTAGGFEWSFVARYGRNRSRVESLGAGITSLPLGPSLWGLSIDARDGEPLPALVGDGYLRDAGTGELLLQNGHPLPDSLNPRVLGSAEPAWTGSFANTLRFRAVQLDFLVDAHIGGQVFSATNLWGQYSGNLAETAVRPDSGILISGIDVATGKQNAQRVSVQDYYHSLLPIQETWVYDATFVKLREARLSVDVPLHWLGIFTAQTLRASVIGRNLWMSARAPNIDPEAALSVSSFQGAELGQLPTARSVGLQLSIVP